MAAPQVMEAYLREDFCSGPFSTSKMSARELQNEQRTAVRSRRGGEARTGKRCPRSATRQLGEASAPLCFRGMLSTVSSGASQLSIGHLKPMKMSVAKGNFRGPCSRRPPHSLHAVL